ncbi:MAG: PEP-CTERM sorting domain-containing protein [Nodularia sp. (in: Bacteria)]|nr:MAG: PEP-CTERM sorting domain-containing protein [Nodularia sp. (in: cyanobacteria)]
MKTLNKIGFAVALASSTIAISTVGMSSAQAFVSGRINITGEATSSPAYTQNNTATISFSEYNDLEIVAGSDFGTLMSSTTVDIASLFLSGGTGTVENPVVQFGNGLEFFFKDSNPFPVTRLDAGFITQELKGYFKLGSDTKYGVFSISAQGLGRGGTGSFSATLDTVEKVPEPTTTLGLAALGLGAFFTNSLAKKKKENVNA